MADVIDNGAVGDGIADDTAAFNTTTAIGGKVIVPKGTYKITAALTLPAGCWIQGEGRGITVINFTGGISGFLSDDGHESVRIEGMTIHGTGAAATYGVKVLSSSYGCIIKDCLITGFGTKVSGSGIYLLGDVDDRDNWNTRIEDCLIDTCGMGILATYSDQFTIDNCTIYGCYGDAVNIDTCRGVIITGGDFDAPVTGGTAADPQYMVHLHDTTEIILTNIVAAGALTANLFADGCENLVLSGCIFGDITSEEVSYYNVINDCDGVAITNCAFLDITTGYYGVRIAASSNVYMGQNRYTGVGTHVSGYGDGTNYMTVIVIILAVLFVAGLIVMSSRKGKKSE